jgi:hypothetical protein
VNRTIENHIAFRNSFYNNNNKYTEPTKQDNVFILFFTLLLVTNCKGAKPTTSDSNNIN